MNKHEMLEEFLAVLADLAHGSLEAGEDAGDPLAQVRRACDDLENAFNARKN